MKRIMIVFITLTSLLLYGCSSLTEEVYIVEMSGIQAHQMMVTPGMNNTIGAQGGDFAITISLQNIDGVPNPNVLKNEYFTESYNLDADFVKLKSRQQIDDRTVRYTFSFEKNTSGKERGIGTRVMDTSYQYGTVHAAICSFSILQKAE